MCIVYGSHNRQRFSPYRALIHYQHHHRVLLLLVDHRASMKSFHALRSPSIPLTSFHDLPVFRISSSICLRHVLFGLPLLLYPWGFQSNAGFSFAPASSPNMCPIQFHFILFIWISIGYGALIELCKWMCLLYPKNGISKTKFLLDFRHRRINKTFRIN